MRHVLVALHDTAAITADRVQRALVALLAHHNPARRVRLLAHLAPNALHKALSEMAAQVVVVAVAAAKNDSVAA